MPAPAKGARPASGNTGASTDAAPAGVNDAPSSAGSDPAATGAAAKGAVPVATALPVSAGIHAPAATAAAPAVAATNAINPAPLAAQAIGRPPDTTPRSVAEPPASAASAYLEEPAQAKTAPQPVRAVSLEFTPDGMSDVKMRLSEHGGEVHISLHSTDSSLTGRIHEGVHDLVGSLSSAGYDAEAWTPGQGRQQQQQRQDENPQQPRPDPSSADGADDFGALFEQPIQEAS